MAGQSKLDTGTGGFPVGENQDLHTFDVGGAEPVGGTWSPGQVAVDKSQKDLSPGTKKTLAAYLSDATLGKVGPSTRPNAYPVAHDASKDPTPLKLTDEKGYPQALTVTQGDQPHFGDIGTGRSNDSVSLNILRGRQEATADKKIDGNFLLKGAAADLGAAPVPAPRGTVNLTSLSAGPIKAYISTVLKTQLNGKLTVDLKYSTDPSISILPSTPVPSTDAGKAHYLSQMTKGQITSTGATIPNIYAVENSEQESPTPARLKTAAGYPAPISVNDTFASVISRSSDSASLNILRGREEASADKNVDGNFLLKGAAVNLAAAPVPAPQGTVNATILAAGPVKSYVSTVLKTSKTGTLTVDTKFDSSGAIQAPRQYGDTDNPLPSATNVTNIKLAASHLADLTDGTSFGFGVPKNKYEILSSDSGPTPLSIVTVQGFTAPLSQITSPTPHFVDTSRITGGRSLSVSMTRGRSGTPTADLPDGNDLLSQAVATALGAPNPPSTGTVNVSSLVDGKPVATYTAAYLKKSLSDFGAKFSVAPNVTIVKSTSVPSSDAGKAHYLSQMTKGQITTTGATVTNKYPIENAASDPPTNLKLKTEGYPTALSAVDTFAPVSTGRSNDSDNLSILRGSEPATATKTLDGNVLLKGAVTPPNSVFNPPSPGTANMGSLTASHPVKTYTESLLGKNTTRGFSGVDAKFSTAVAILTARQYGASSDPLPRFATIQSEAASGQRLSEMTAGTLSIGIGGSKNDYKIVPATGGKTTPFSTITSDGYTPALLQLSDANTPHFVDTSKITGGRSNKSVSITRGNSGAATATSPNGNTLLPSGVTPLAAPLLPPAKGTVNSGTDILKDPIKTYLASQVGSLDAFNVKFDLPGAVQDARQYDSATRPLPSFKTIKAESADTKHVAEMTDGTWLIGYAGSKNAYQIKSGSPTALKLVTTEGYTPTLTQLTDATVPHFANTPSLTGGRSGTAVSMTRGKSGKAKADSPTGNDLLANAVTPVKSANDALNSIRGTFPNMSALVDAGPVKNYFDKVLEIGKKTAGTTVSYDAENPFPGPADGPVEIKLSLKDPNKIVPDGDAVTRPDLSAATKQTIGSLLRDTATANRYGPAESIGQTRSIRKDKILTQPLAPARSSSFLQNKNLKSRSNSASSIGDNPRNSDILTTATEEDLQSSSSKTNLNPSLDEKGFLPSVGSTQASADYGKYSQSVLKNRFNKDAQYSKNPKTETTFQSIGETVVDSFGTPGPGRKFSKKYTPGSSKLVGDDQEAARSMSLGSLAQVGTALMTRAADEAGSLEKNGWNPTSGGQEGADLGPGWGQLGVNRFDRDLLTAKSVIEDLTSDPIDSRFVISPATQTWGAINHPLDTYSGFDAFGMVLLSLALFVALIIIILALSFLFALLPTGENTVQYDAHGRRPFGAYDADPGGGDYTTLSGIIKAATSGKFNFWRMIGISNTRNPIEVSLLAGAMTFYGLEIDPNQAVGAQFGKGLVDGALAVTAAAGYYTIASRTITRSFLTLADAFSGLSFTSFASGLKSLLSIIGIFQNSRFFRVINLFGKIGDTAITDVGDAPVGNPGWYGFDKTALGFKKHRTHLDRYDIETRPDIMRSRMELGGGENSSTTLAWAAHRAPDLLLMPRSVYSLSTLGSTVGNLNIPGFMPSSPVGKGGIRNEGVYRHGTGVNEARISTEEREKIETLLDAEYVPFYLHDVRTNEVLSFHAFLASLSDDYSASYDSTEAFGRVEPIKTYKGTSRKIGFSFHIVSTNPSDFDSMWLKINKLTTMVYPQFTEGRTIVDTTNGLTVTAPFSQTIQAAPLVRLRIGDVVRSNYSKFNLARLFGFSYAGSQFAPDKKLPDGSSLGATGGFPGISYGASLKAARLSNNPSYKWVTGKILAYHAKNGDVGSGIGAALTSLFKKPGYAPVPHSLPAGYYLQVIGTGSAAEDYSDTRGLVQVKVVEATAGDGVGIPEPHEKAKYGDPDKATHFLKDQTYWLHPSDLIPTAATRALIQKAARVGDDQPLIDYTTAAADFMNDDPSATNTKGNAVAKSFRTAGGKGLAGFIDSLNFDWYDKAPWEINMGAPTPGDISRPAEGRRAPMMCKVTVSFSPIHDITPGLDHVGFNRAPIYPVASSYSSGDATSIGGTPPAPSPAPTAAPAPAAG